MKLWGDGGRDQVQTRPFKYKLLFVSRSFMSYTLCTCCPVALNNLVKIDQSGLWGQTNKSVTAHNIAHVNSGHINPGCACLCVDARVVFR